MNPIAYRSKLPDGLLERAYEHIKRRDQNDTMAPPVELGGKHLCGEFIGLLNSQLVLQDGVDKILFYAIGDEVLVWRKNER